MPTSEALGMDTSTAFSHTNRRKRTCCRAIVLLAIYLCSIIATGLLVYNFISCPEVPFTSKICDHHFSSNRFNQNNSKIHTHSDNNPLKTSSSSTISTTLTVSSTETTTGENDVDLRLPRSVKPFSYDIKLIPYLIEKNFTFDGNVKIIVKILEDNLKNITLHSTSIKIERESDVEVHLIDNENDKKFIENLKVDTVSFLESKQFLIIDFKDSLLVDRFYIIQIKYKGLLNDNLQGFYRSTYTSGNQTRWLATTQFQPTDARRAFPCFDEPAMKARFSIKIARPNYLTTISNMPKVGSPIPVEGLLNYVWDTYQESVPMSTYLVAFVVSDFLNISSGNFAVWARADVIHSAKYALEVGPKMLKFLEKFFDIDYPLPKLDMIALPDFSAGAMENWGLVTYRETAMLYEEGVSAHINKQRVATVVAHELAHQWFGNLVTPSWWSDLWLNEGFASYMEYLGVDAVEPTWKSMDQFVVNELQNVFSLDALSSSHPISIQVNNPDEINDIFDRISYGKGATIIRMMDHFLTSTVFKRGLSNYLRDRAYQSAEQDDLWEALTEEARYTRIFDNETSVKEIMDTWTLQTGFPVVNVQRNYIDHTVTLSQERFVLIESTKNHITSEKENALWWIPITYTTFEEMNFNSTRPTHWMKGKKMLHLSDVQVPNNHWIILNIQQTGYYRVNYDTNNWDLIIAYLRNSENYKDIAPSNRAQLIDDALNLARSGHLDYNTALDVTRYLEHETDFIPWKAAINALNFIDSMLMKGGDYHQFKVYFLNLIEKVYNSVGFEDTKTNDILTIFKRVDVLAAACHLGYKDCINQSVKKFHAWMNQPDPDKTNPISPNLKNIVYCTAIKYGDESEWDFAWERFRTTKIPSEREIIMSALGCSREIWILNRYLERSMSDKYGIRKQDVFRVFGAVSNNIVGQPIAFNYLRNNWDFIKEYFGQSMTNLNAILKYSTRRLNNKFELNELKRFASQHLNEGGRTLQQAIEKAEANIDWMNKNYNSIVSWLGRANQR